MIILKAGANFIDSYCIFVDKEYVLMVENCDKELLLRYEIVKNSKQLEIYLMDKNFYVIDYVTILIDQLPRKK